MGKLRVLLDALNSLTGISARHNKALRDIKDWVITVQKFLTVYDLYGSPNLDSLIENIGKAKFDLTAIAHKARPLINTAKNIKGEQMVSLIVDLTENVGNLRRTLINPSLQDVILKKDILSLLTSFEKLQDALSGTDYM